MNRRDFLENSLKATLLYTGAGLLTQASQSCIKQAEPEGELDTRIPFQYLKVASDFSFIQLYGEAFVGNELRYVLLFGQAGGGVNAARVEARSGQLSGTYSTVNPYGVKDGAMRFNLPLDITVKRGPCLYQDSLTNVTYAGMSSNSNVLAELETPIYPNASPVALRDYQQQLSEFRLNSDYLPTLDTGTVAKNIFGQKTLNSDNSFLLCL